MASASLAMVTVVSSCRRPFHTIITTELSLFRDLIELFFPRSCCLCGAPLLGSEHDICLHCLQTLPEALTAQGKDNIVDHRLMGRINYVAATSLLLFSQGNNTQRMLHQIKYRGNEPLAVTMGRQMGLQLTGNHLFDDVDIIIPVPLHPRKQRRRGYNQSLLLCRGITQTFARPVSSDNLIRIRHTASQTHMNREERFNNMNGVFRVLNPHDLIGKHILIVDDVITTGATLEACCTALKDIQGLRISIATLAVTDNA